MKLVTLGFFIQHKTKGAKCERENIVSLLEIKDTGGMKTRMPRKM